MINECIKIKEIKLVSNENKISDFLKIKNN